jgi:hypothetical protein
MRLFVIAAGVVVLCGVALVAGLASYLSREPSVAARVPPVSSLPQPSQSTAPAPVLPTPETPPPVAATPAAAVAQEPPAEQRPARKKRPRGP